TVAINEKTGGFAVPQGSMGYRWPGQNEPKGRWNLEAKDGETGEDVRLGLSVFEHRYEVLSVAFPYFGGRPHEHFPENDQRAVLLRNVPAKRVTLASGETFVTTVFDLICCPTRRRGRRPSRACQPRGRSPSHASSPTTRRRRADARW